LVASLPSADSATFSWSMALASVWRLRSLLTPKFSPISASVFLSSVRKRWTMISRSRSLSVFRASST